MKKLLLILLLASTAFPSFRSAARSFHLDAADSTIQGISGVNKFGHSNNVDNGVNTDIWDRANTTDDQDIWIAPTESRVHNIASSDNADSVGNGGARTIRIYGLPSWSIREISEVITMDGTNDVATVNSYVIIHRMRVLVNGGTAVNVGTITATAQTDATVTAQINPSKGQTAMAILGIPSIQNFYMTQFGISINKGSGGAGAREADCLLLCCENPVEVNTTFTTKFLTGKATTGTSNGAPMSFFPFKKFPGPCILKLQCTSDANNTDITGSFDGILLDKAP